MSNLESPFRRLHFSLSLILLSLPSFFSLLCRFSDLPPSTLRHGSEHALTHARAHTLTQSSVCTSPGTPGKGRAKMEMNSAMLQVATQICICNYPEKHMGSFLFLFLFLLLPVSWSPSPLSYLYHFPTSVCLTEPLFSSSLSISHSLSVSVSKAS